MSQHIKTWQERMTENGYDPANGAYMLYVEQEIADLRAALDQARRPDSGKVAEGKPVATVIKKGAGRQWMSENLGALPDGIYSLYLAPAADSAATEQVELCESDKQRVDWCVRVLEGVKNKGREFLGDAYPEIISVVGALRCVLKPDLPDVQPAKHAAEPELMRQKFTEIYGKPLDGDIETHPAFSDFREGYLAAAPASADVGELPQKIPRKVSAVLKGLCDRFIKLDHNDTQKAWDEIRTAIQASSAAPLKMDLSKLTRWGFLNSDIGYGDRFNVRADGDFVRWEDVSAAIQTRSAASKDGDN